MIDATTSFLRYVEPSGGLFTENVLLRLRDLVPGAKLARGDKPLKAIARVKDKPFRDAFTTTWEWAIRRWDEIAVEVDGWDQERLFAEWIDPLFSRLHVSLESYHPTAEEKEESADDPLRGFTPSHEAQGHHDPFIHVVPPGDDLEARVSTNPGGKSHHATLQQFVNLHSSVSWLVVTNGRLVRLLTTYYHIYSKGYLQFDLENILAKRDEREFFVFFALLHGTSLARVGGEPSLLDAFREFAIQEGVKVGDSLRDNVHEALQVLGQEFLAQNPAFREAAASGTVDVEALYPELLRVIYRVIFILYAEQREMLPGGDSLYFKQYSLTGLKLLAERPIRRDREVDLWRRIWTTFRLMAEGNAFLGVNAFNGSLFHDENLPLITEYGLHLSNDIVLRVVRLLTTTVLDTVRIKIDFKLIEEEEIGSVYESLLDYRPVYHKDAGTFELIPISTERKTTASYYTPKALIDILIRRVLVPVVEEKLMGITNPKEAERALLSIKVCDPACGSGSFLLATMDYLGEILTQIKFGDITEQSARDSRRLVLQHCIFGVDKNPLAIELAKISLWLRACVKDKPLNFLDHHLKTGNSLIGMGKRKLPLAIHPNAYTAVTNSGILKESKDIQKKARIKTKKDLKKTADIKPLSSFFELKELGFDVLEEMNENNISAIKKKKESYLVLLKKQKYTREKFQADTWTAAFFWPLTESETKNVPTSNTINQAIDHSIPKEILSIIEKIRESQGFFHWYLEFPDVFSRGMNGFDVILMNPPWEVYSLIEEEFFASKGDFVIAKSRSRERMKLIKALSKKNPQLFIEYIQAKHSFEKGKNYFRNSNRYELTAKGKLDVYPLFAELGYSLLGKNGALGIICPPGIIYSHPEFFSEITKNKHLSFCYGFINKKKIFPIASQKQFLALVISKINKKRAIFSFNNEDFEAIFTLSNFYSISPSELELINPISRTPPFPRNQEEFDLLKKVYRNGEYSLIDISQHSNFIQIHRMFNISDDRRKGLLKLKEELLDCGFELDRRQVFHKKEEEYFPTYEGKLIFQYNYRYGTYRGVSEKIRRSRRARCKRNTDMDIPLCEPRYWVEKKHFLKKIQKWKYKKSWFLAYRESTGPKNRRSMVFSIIPGIPTVYTIYNFINLTAKQALLYICQLNSIVLDFIFRKKLVTNHLTQEMISQFPFIPMTVLEKNTQLILPLVFKLVYVNEELKEFATEYLGEETSPFQWDNEERFDIQRRLDAIVSILFKLNKADIKLILSDFEVWEKKEVETFGEFRSKNLILQYFDEYLPLLTL